MQKYGLLLTRPFGQILLRKHDWQLPVCETKRNGSIVISGGKASNTQSTSGKYCYLSAVTAEKDEGTSHGEFVLPLHRFHSH